MVPSPLRALLARRAPWLAALALSCATASSTEPAAPPGLYSASARDYGFAFDARTWELERRPQLSVVRTCNHSTGVVSAQTFFIIGCEGELARLRGFDYIATLRSWPTDCARDPRDTDRVFVLGFAHEPSGSALPQGARDEIGPGVSQSFSEASASIELARRKLGHWPARSRSSSAALRSTPQR